MEPKRYPPKIPIRILKDTELVDDTLVSKGKYGKEKGKSR